MHRMAVLAGLTSVDWVVFFDEDTPQRLIGDILPFIGERRRLQTRRYCRQ